MDKKADSTCKKAKQVREWTQSTSGKTAIKEALREARSKVTELQKASQVNPNSLREPFTV